MEKKFTDEEIEQMLRDGKEIIFQEEREKHSKQKFLDKFNELQAKSKLKKRKRSQSDEHSLNTEGHKEDKKI